MSNYLVRSTQCLSCMDHGGELVPVHRDCLNALEAQIEHLRAELHDARDFIAEEAARANSIAQQAAYEGYEAGRAER